MAKTLDQRLAAANLIKSETIPSANTAPRVGGAMEDMNNAWNEETGEINVTTAFPPVSGYHTAETARNVVLESYRRKGRTITYQTAAGTWVKEQFRGDSTATWLTASNWYPILMSADQDVYNVTNKVPLAAGEYYNPTTARNAVPTQIRKLGLGLKYLSGYREIDTLTITGPAITDGNIIIFLNGVQNMASPVIIAGNTAIEVATKIRTLSWPGWTTGGTAGTAVVTFTRTAYDAVSAPTFSNTAGITATFTRTSSGQLPDWIHEEFTGPSTASWTTTDNWRNLATSTDIVSIENDLNENSNVFNVSMQVPLAPGQFYTLSTAIAAVPQKKWKCGLTIIFSKKDYVWETANFSRSFSTAINSEQWNNLDYWTIDSVSDRTNYILDYTTDKKTTRKLVKLWQRYPGVKITYNDGTDWITEQFTGLSGNPIYDSSWIIEESWVKLPTGKDLQRMEAEKSTGKNLLNPNSPYKVSGFYLSANGMRGASGNFYISGFIRITPAGLKLNSASYSSATYHCYYDENFNFISSIVATETYIPYVEGAEYVKCSVYISHVTQIERGSFTTSYEPYQNDGFVINTGGVDRVRTRLYPNIKLPVISFNFDDLSSNDASIVSLFLSKGLTAAGFAFIASDSNVINKSAEYISYQNQGFSILSHSVNGTIFNTTNYNITTALAAIMTAKNKIEKAGMIPNGWVSPSSKLDQSFLPIIKKAHAYAFTYNDDGANGRTSNSCTLTRYSMESYDLATIQSRIDADIAADKILTLYGHGSSFSGTGIGAGEFNLTKLGLIIEYCISKRDAGLCSIMNTDDCVKYYFNL